MTGVRRRDTAVLLAAAPTILLVVWWAADDGGYFPSAWLPGTLALACSLAIVFLALGPSARLSSRALAVAAAALLAYTVWSFVSIGWAQAPGTALEGSQRTLLYAIAFAGFAILPWTPRTVLWVMTAFVLGAIVIGVVTLLRAASLEQPGEIFVTARLSAPLGYYNAAAAFWTMAALPAIVLASRPETLTLLRPVLLGGAVVLLGLAVLAQSRGWLFSLPVAAIVALALVPGRARLVLFGLPVAPALGIALPDLLEPYRVGHLAAPAAAAPDMRDALDSAARTLLIAAIAAAVAGALLVLGERALHTRTHTGEASGRRWLPRVPGGPAAPRRLAALLAVGAAVAIGVAGQPIERLYSAWSDFTTIDDSGRTQGNDRFTSLGGARYDFWRVGLSAWRDAPVLGLGQDNFELEYTRERRTDEEPRWVHSLPLRLLVHTGAVGGVLFGGFVVALGCALGAGRRAAGSAHRAALAAAILPGAVWLAHGSVDWLWEFPALSVSALAFAAAAASMRPRPDLPAGAPTTPGRPPRARWRAVAATGATALVFAFTLPSYIAGREVRDAQRAWPADPAGAFDDLERAKLLAPLDPRAPLVEGLIASQVGPLAAAYSALLEARERDPHNWFVHFELGLVARELSQSARARSHLRIARRLNPREPLTIEALERLSGARPMSVAEAAVSLGRRVDARLGRP